MTNNVKAIKLKETLSRMKKVLVAYSGGVDSTFLLYSAKQALGGENVLAVVAESPTYPKEEVVEAITLSEKIGIKCRLIQTEEFSDENFLKNSRERCYYCKIELFQRLKILANENGIRHVIDGSNFDDLNDYRPGNKAKAQFGVRSPLQELEFTKAEIRELSKAAGLPTHDKPSMACLASRVPYGTRIDQGILKMVAAGEKYLRTLGFKQLRVRHHNNVARIEVEKELLPKIMEQSVMDGIVKKFEEIGYIYVTIDLKGFRSGSMNDG